jgi:hypothetical protein
LEKREEQVLPGSRGHGEEGGGWWRAGGRDGSNNVYTYEEMYKQLKINKFLNQ